MTSKTIFTGYFARHNGHPKAVSITATRPSWFKGQHCSDLAPSWNIVAPYKRGELTEFGYEVNYFAQLNAAHRTADEIIRELPDGAVLLCYEKPPAFCHRQLAARWLTRYASFGVLRSPIVELVL